MKTLLYTTDENMARIESVIDTFKSIYGFDPDGIYCLATGKRIGSGDGEIIYLINDLTDSDLEACADDIAMRLFASMRPSMRWNKLRIDSIDLMRKSVPVETMCFLLGRLMGPIDSRKESFADFCKINGERIQIYQWLSLMPIDEQFEMCMTQLLDIDSKRSLTTIEAPFTYFDILKSVTSWTQLLALLDPWHTKQLEAWAKSQREARFMQANPLARSAFLRSAMETKPPSKTQVKKAASKAKDSFLEGLLAELLGAESTYTKADPAPSVRQQKPAVNQALPKPTKFGVKRA